MIECDGCELKMSGEAELLMAEATLILAKLGETIAKDTPTKSPKDVMKQIYIVAKDTSKHFKGEMK